MAKLRSVDWAVLFNATEPLPWTEGPGETPPERWFAITHVDEQITDPIQRSWELLRIPGVVVAIEHAAADLDGSHRLATSWQACTGDPESLGFFHNCDAVDANLPAPVDGTPHFADVWTYLLPAPAGGVGG